MLDLWRFPNDWHRNPIGLAHDLAAFIDDLTNPSNTSVALSCKVDLVVHSNGGVIAGAYVQGLAEPGGRARAQQKVNRFINAGVPYLGATQAVKGHTQGYIFEVEETPVGWGWEVDWGRMLRMTRNIPGAYALLPSRAYWEVGQQNFLHAYLWDFHGRPLRSYDEVFAFLTSPKVSQESGKPFGMGRNGSLWAQMQLGAHALIDDWRAYDGPPQVFRHVGAIPGSTSLKWVLEPEGPDFLSAEVTTRDEPDDTGYHRAYRERLVPLKGLGDATVPLLSATLGRDQRVGRFDYSGVDESPWIEEFEYYDCKHADLMLENCRRLADGVGILDRTLAILQSSHIVPGPDDPAAPTGRQDEVATASKTGDAATVPAREVVTVTSAVPIDVVVEDAEGNRTGPVAPGSVEISYDVPGALYEAALFGAVVSLPAGRTYSVTATPVPSTASGKAAVETAIRVRREVADADDQRQAALFSPVAIGAGGQLRLPITAAADPSTPLEADTDGDGSFEPVAPALVVPGTWAEPAVPYPWPLLLLSKAPEGAMTDTLTIPAGGGSWTWTLEGAPDWATPALTSGEAPAEVVFDFDASGLGEGEHRDTLALNLRQGAYAITYPVEVVLAVGEGLGSEDGGPERMAEAFHVSAVYPNPIQDEGRFELAVREPQQVRVELFDAVGRRVALLYDGRVATSEVLRLRVNGEFLPSGVYHLRVTGDDFMAIQSLVRMR